MKKLLLMALFITLASAQVNVITTYPYITDIVKNIGADHVRVRALAKGYNDPHFIVPKPSHIGKIKQADLLIKNGGELEIGWLPTLVERANNSTLVQLDLSEKITMIEVPEKLSREFGDIHAKGNPHFHLDPYNILIMAKDIAQVLSKIDPKHSLAYEKNYQTFIARWETDLHRWEKTLASFKGVKVITYHKLFNYFYKRFSINNVMDIEALPGITPSASHIHDVIDVAKKEKVSYIISDVYHRPQMPHYIANQSKAQVLIIPHDIAALPAIENLEQLFDYMIEGFKHD